MDCLICVDSWRGAGEKERLISAFHLHALSSTDFKPVNRVDSAVCEFKAKSAIVDLSKFKAA